MNIIHVAAEIFLVAEGVFPIPALPYSAFALAVPAGEIAIVPGRSSRWEGGWV